MGVVPLILSLPCRDKGAAAGFRVTQGMPKGRCNYMLLNTSWGLGAASVCGVSISFSQSEFEETRCRTW